MTQTVRNIYAAGNTARGYRHLYDSVLKGLDRVYVVSGAPGSGKSTVIKSIGEELQKQGYDVEWIHCPLNNDSVDGVIFSQLKVGIVEGSAVREIQPIAPYLVESYVDLSLGCSFEAVNKDRIMQLEKDIGEGLQKAYDTFAEALKIHDEWERIYITNMNYDKADEVTSEMVNLLLGNQMCEKPSNVRHMYFGAATPKGPVDYIQNLTSPIEKRYFIKGRPGSGKSTMLKKIAAEAEQRGFDVEVYHCGFDPNSIDMVMIPERSVAIFDSTAPHEYFPDRETDEIVDMYERTIVAGTDERYAGELLEIKNRYSQKMREATEFLAKTKILRDEVVSLYQHVFDYSKTEKIKQDILCQLQ
jgi:ABC-type ATPase involved in cell division